MEETQELEELNSPQLQLDEIANSINTLVQFLTEEKEAELLQKELDLEALSQAEEEEKKALEEQTLLQEEEDQAQQKLLEEETEFREQVLASLENFSSDNLTSLADLIEQQNLQLSYQEEVFGHVQVASDVVIVAGCIIPGYLLYRYLSNLIMSAFR